MKNRMNSNGFTLVEGLLIVVVVAVVAALSVFGYKHLKNNNNSAGASTYTFIHHINQMANYVAYGASKGALRTVSYGGITYASFYGDSRSTTTDGNSVTTFVASSEITSASKVCFHYRNFSTSAQGHPYIVFWGTSASTPIADSPYTIAVSPGKTGNLCAPLKQKQTGFVIVYNYRSPHSKLPYSGRMGIERVACHAR